MIILRRVSLSSGGGCRILGLQELEKIGEGGFVEFGGFGVLAVDTVVDAGGFVLAFGAGLQGQGDLLAWLFPPLRRMASCRKEVT